MYIAGAETRRIPPEFQARLTRTFGQNQFGDPLFRIAWGQSEFIRIGHEWKDKFGRTHHGYQDRYAGGGNPCWMIMQWKPASHYGSPETYYANTWIAHRTAGEDPSHPYDSVDGFYVTGEYPWRGRYEIVVPLMEKKFVDNKLVIEHLPLNHYLIDVIIPLILEWQKLTLVEREIAKRAEEEAESKRMTEEISERMMDALPAWYGPVSFSRQGCRTSLLDRKMFEIQKKWDQLSRNGLRPDFQRGMAQGSRPKVRYN